MQWNNGQGSSNEPTQWPISASPKKPAVALEPEPQAPTMALETMDVMVSALVKNTQETMHVRGVIVLYLLLPYVAAFRNSG